MPVNTWMLIRLRHLRHADTHLAVARQIAVAHQFNDVRRYEMFMDSMNIAASLYRNCELSLLSRRVRATRLKCLAVLRLKPEQQKERLSDIWQQFDELNAKDHFDYTARDFGSK